MEREWVETWVSMVNCSRSEYESEIFLLTNDTSQADSLSNSVYHVRIESN